VSDRDETNYELAVEAGLPLSPRSCLAGREPERGVPNQNGLLSPTLSSLWEEREKKLPSHSTIQ